MYEFLVNYKSIDKSDILNIHSNLMTKNNIKWYSALSNKCLLYYCFSESLALDQTKYQFLNDEPCIVRPTLASLNAAELKYCPFMITLDKCTGGFNDIALKICFPKET